MNAAGELRLDPARLRELFDLGGDVYAARGGAFDIDINPIFNARRDQAPRCATATPGMARTPPARRVVHAARHRPSACTSRER